MTTISTAQPEFYKEPVASNYDRLVEWVVRRWGESPREKMADFVAPRWAENGVSVDRVLEICCGTGLMLDQLVRRGYQVTGLDRSGHMLERARERLGTRVDLIHAELPSIPTGKPFDAVLSSAAGLNYLTPERLGETMRSVARVLKPGGMFVFDTLSPSMLRKHMPERLGEDLLATNLGDVVFIWDFARSESGDYSDLTYIQFSRDAGVAGDGSYTRTTELHRMYPHDPDTTRPCAHAAGFVDVEVFDNYTDQPAGPDALYHTWVLERGR